MRPRHYVLIALVVALGIFNIYRMRHMRNAPTEVPVAVSTGPVPQSASWSAFDKAVALRDAPPNDFDPALQALNQAEQSAPGADKTVSDVRGCKTWLLFYRQGVLHPSKDTSWRDRSMTHLDACVKTHHDAG